MKLCLVNPAASFLEDPAVFPPLGLYYLKSAISNNLGWHVEVVDLGLNETVPDDADVYGLTGTSVQIEAIQAALTEIPIDHPCVTIAGGPWATAEPTEAARMGFDYVIQGEAEHTLYALLCALQWEQAGPFGTIIQADTPTHLDSLFRPDRSDARKYKYVHNGRLYTTAISARGCPFKCAFCSRVGDQRVRYHSAEYVARECREIASLDFGGVYFYDDTFNMNIPRLKAMQPLLADTGLEFRGMARAHLMTPEVAKLMYDTGFRVINVGVESGSDVILSNIQKGETTGQILEGIQCSLDAGLEVKAYIIVGLPGETPRTAQETYELCHVLRAMGVLDFNFHLLQVIPGSDIWSHPTLYDVTFNRGTHMLAKQGEYHVTSHTAGMTPDALLDQLGLLRKEFKTWKV